MSRIRSIKPEFWTSDQVVECSTTARLLFVGMWNFCDDQGIHPASTKRLKMEIFPADNFTLDDIAGWVDELITHGLIREYTVMEDEKAHAYWQVTGWFHQKIEKPNKKYPLPPVNAKFADQSSTSRRTVDDQSTTNQRALDDRSPEDRIGKERKGKVLSEPFTGGAKPSPEPPQKKLVPRHDLETQPLNCKTQPLETTGTTCARANGDSKSSLNGKGSRLPEDWVLPKTWGEWALGKQSTWTAAYVREVAESFADYWHSKPGGGARKTDWLATWRNWVRKQPPPRNGHPSQAGVKPSLHEQNLAAAKRAKILLFGSEPSEKDISDEAKRV